MPFLPTTYIGSEPLLTLGFLACFLAFLARSWVLSLITPKGIPGIPAYPDPTPVLADIPRIAASLKAQQSNTAFFQQVGRDLGPIAQVRLTGLKTLVVVNDYTEIISILNRHQQFDRASHTASFFRNVMPTAQFVLPHNDVWRQHRRLTAGSNSPKGLSTMTPGLVRNIRRLVDLFEVKNSRAEGRPWETKADMYSAALDMITEAAFGQSLDILDTTTKHANERDIEVGSLGEAVFCSERPAIAQAAIYLMIESIPVKASFPELARRLQRLSPYWNKQQRLMQRYLRDQLDASRQRMRAKGDGAAEAAGCHLDMMVVREMQGMTVPDAEMIDEAMLYVVGGTETVAVALQWYPKFMANLPHVQHKLRAHLLERIPELQDREMTYDDVASGRLPYLEAVVYEVLRMARVAPALAREAIVNTTVLGHSIPKGTMIVLPASYGHTMEVGAQAGGPVPSVKVDGEKDIEKGTFNPAGNGWASGTGSAFDPERWLKDGEFDSGAGPSLPFSVGLRSCFGKKLALLELRLVIAHFTLAFFFAPLEDRFNSQDTYEVLATHPKQTFVRLQKW